MEENSISEDFEYGSGLQIGKYVVVEKDVVVGQNVTIGHRVTLKSGTVIGNNSVIDDHCITTGACYIGNNVNIRTGAIISRGTIIEDFAFIGPGVVTNHTKHVTHGRHNIVDEQLITYVGYGAIIGSQASILAGVNIDPLAIIGGGSVVIEHVKQAVYVGAPAKPKSEIPPFYQMDLPEDAGEMYMSSTVKSHMKKYMPALNLEYIFK